MHNSVSMASAPRTCVLIVLFLMTLLSCSGQGETRWLFKRSAHGCPSLTAQCPCGEDGRTTVIQVKQCPFSTDWEPLCEPCVPTEELCRRLKNCSRCSDDNPAGICAECPPTLYGEHCEHELKCKDLELSPFIKSRPIISEVKRKRKRRRRSGRRKSGSRLMYKLVFSCPDNMILRGPRVIKCKSNGRWNRHPPRCLFPLECPTEVPPIVGARVTERTNLYVRYACDKGYINVTNVTEARMQCENGEWVSVGEDGLLKCEPLAECAGWQSAAFRGARLTQDSPDKGAYLHGEQLHYECQPGYSPSNSGVPQVSRTCDDGTWTGMTPECVKTGCPKFGVAGGWVRFEPQSESGAELVDLHTVAHLQCLESHNLSPPSHPGNLTCIDRDKWSSEIPRCEMVCGNRKTCPVPSIANAISDTERTQILPGEIVRFRCEQGAYRKLSTPSTDRFCLINGTLTGTDIECQRLWTCNITELQLHSKLQYCKGEHCASGTSSHIDTFELPADLVSQLTTLTFTSCEDDKYYELSGTHTKIKCLPGNQFDPRPPYCKLKCGLRSAPIKPLVLGGTATNVTEWPWQAGLLRVKGNNVEFLCGSILIAEQWALTAAHCVYEDKNNNYTNPDWVLRPSSGLNLVAGVQEHPERAGRQLRHGIAQIIKHYSYTPGSFDNDIALLKLARPVTLSEKVGVACLPCGDSGLEAGIKGVVTGWDLTLRGLRVVDLTVIDADDCKKHFRSKSYNDVDVTNNMFCAASNNSTNDASNGDSGGPFLIKAEDGRYMLEGIVSWGETHFSSSSSDTSVHLAPARKSNKSSVNAKTTLRSSSGDETQATNHYLAQYFGNSEGQGCKGKVCYGGYTKVSNYVGWIKEATGLNICGS